MVCGMFVCVSLSINVCMFTVSNALLMSNATAMVRVGGMGWLKPVATVLLMLCIQCSIMLHLMDIFLLTCICLWQISRIQTFLGVVGPRLVSTSPAFMRSRASYLRGPHGRLAQKNRAPITWGRRGRHNLHSGLPDHCDSSTACRLCRLEHL